MKKLFLLGAMVCALGMMTACTEKDNGGSNEPTPIPTDTVKWVDLGLPSGLLWAECNLGSSSPEEYGNYYAWGETQPKDFYFWNTYRYCTLDNAGVFQTLTKYNTLESYGTVDSLTTLQAIDDAATAALGNSARTPTMAEWEELIANTTAEWTTQNNVNGYLFTATNGNTLFLPAAGIRWSEELRGESTNGAYLSSTLCTELPYQGNTFRFYSEDYFLYYDNRCSGLSVRAVRGK